MALIQVNFRSMTLRKTVTFQVIIPDEVHSSPGGADTETGFKPLRTLYLLHGYTGNYTDWTTYTEIHKLADTFRLAVVMPSGDNSFYLDDFDKSELYGEFIGRELVEYTRFLFPLSGSREDTYIGGLSMGGFGAVRNGLKYSGTFGKVISFSGAFITISIIENDCRPFDDEVTSAAFKERIFGSLDTLAESDRNPLYIARQLEEQNRPVPEVLMICGTEDSLLAVNHKTRDRLRAEGIPVRYIEHEGAHNWDFWGRYLEEALEWTVGEK